MGGIRRHADERDHVSAQLGTALDIVLTRLRDQWHSSGDNTGTLIIQL